MDPPETPAPGPDLEGREQRLHLARGAPRTRDGGGTPWKLPYAAIVTAAACHHRLGMPYRLLSDLLGAHGSTITPGTPAARITTHAQLRDHAAARGITIKTTRPRPPT